MSSAATPAFHLAQLNIGRLRALPGSPQVADFFARLDEMNALAERSPGFVWRLKSDTPEQGIPLGDDARLLVNLSVWRDIETLFDYVYRSAHREPLGRRRDWFEPAAQPHQVMWWVPAGHRPDAAEALARLELLRRDGPGPAAFNFVRRFDAAGRPLSARPAAA